MTAPLRVLQVIDTMATGGAQQVVVRLASASQHRADVELAVTVLSESADRRLVDELRSIGTEVTWVVPGTRRNLADPRTPVRLARRIRRFDVVQSHLGTANVLAPLAAALARRPSIATLHSVSLATGERRRGSGARHRAVDVAQRRLATVVVAVGEAVRAAGISLLGRRDLPVIANPAPPPAPIDAGERRGARAAHALAADAFVLVAVGRLEEPKGYDVLLAALEDLPEAVVLLVAGEGSERSRLERTARERGLDRRVRLLGTRDDVPAVLAAADAFVSSSRREGMPMAVLEAMARGLPVVATAVGDVGATVGDAGIVVEPGDPAALAGAIRRLHDDPDRRAACGAAALRRATENGEGPWLDRWIELWRSVA